MITLLKLQKSLNGDQKIINSAAFGRHFDWMQNFKGRGDLNLVARDCSKRVEFCLPSGNTPTLEQTVLVSLTKIDFLYFLLTV